MSLVVHRVFTIDSPAPVLPSGAGSLEKFSNTCTACGRCLSVCRTRVLKLKQVAHNTKKTLLPVMDFTRGHCFYWCSSCTSACSTGALAPLTVSEKQRTKIGCVTFSPGRCIVITARKECCVCAEVCKPRAEYTVEEGGMLVPRVNDARCTGCGHCTLVCPVLPKKALTVFGLTVHRKAQKPRMPDGWPHEPRPIGPDDDFPF